MTKEKLEQLYDLRQEIRELTMEIEKLSAKEFKTVTDSVQASMHEWPYCKSSVKITGHDFEGERRNRERIAKKKELLEIRCKAAEEMETEILEYINSVKNSKIRRIMQKHYINLVPWKKIALELHTDASYPAKLVMKYLKDEEKEVFT